MVEKSGEVVTIEELVGGDAYYWQSKLRALGENRVEHRFVDLLWILHGNGLDLG